MSTTPAGIRLSIGHEDYAFLASVANALDLSVPDAVAAFWKIGATAYVANRLGYELPATLLDFKPDDLYTIWQQWLAMHPHQQEPTP